MDLLGILLDLEMEMLFLEIIFIFFSGFGCCSASWNCL